MIRRLAQLFLYAGFAALIGYASAAPQYRLLDAGEAMLSLSFSHAAERVEACRRLSQEELQSLPPNMRKPDECPRERHALRVSLTIDDQLVHEETALPSGLWRDGKANVYYRLRIATGEYDLRLAMNDSGRDGVADFELQQTVQIEPGRNVVISFDGAAGNFVIE